MKVNFDAQGGSSHRLSARGEIAGPVESAAVQQPYYLPPPDTTAIVQADLLATSTWVRRTSTKYRPKTQQRRGFRLCCGDEKIFQNWALSGLIAKHPAVTGCKGS